MAEGKPGFWSTLPGVLTGLAALITSVSGIYFGYLKPQHAAVAPATPAQPANTAGKPAQPAPAEAPRPGDDEVRATIVDPDGWTNLRAGPSTSSAVVGRVNQGELFWTRPRDGLWWPARTAGGREGYVHRSRIRLNP
jgi:uncharacterized protein YgiM (DUF1202 family)